MIESPLWFMGIKALNNNYGQTETISHDKDNVITGEHRNSDVKQYVLRSGNG